ncbi:MAG: hypothetical protein ACQEXJ_05965 [Myxococcota bacterium]
MTWVKLLLLLHAVAAGVLAGASIHNGILAWRHWIQGRKVNLRLQRLYPKIIGVAWIITLGLGLWIYPTFRVDVRAASLDANLPLATSLFEIKEHWLGLGTLMLAYLVPTSARLARDHVPPLDSALYHLLSVLLAAAVVWAVLVGLALTAIRPV